MSVSVNVSLEIVNFAEKPENPDLKIHVRSNGMVGVVYTDWNSLVGGVEATGYIRGPSGRGLQPSRKRMKQESMRQEQESAESLGGRRQSGSGARPGNKGDGQVLDQGAIDALQGAPGRFRIENKYVTGTEARIKLSELRKIRSECTGQETPVFDVQFKETATLRTIDNWVLVPRRNWESLVQAHDHR